MTMKKEVKGQKKSDVLKALLIKLNCFDAFVENLKNYKGETFEEYANDPVRHHYPMSDFIWCAFNFENTPEEKLDKLYWETIALKIDTLQN